MTSDYSAETTEIDIRKTISNSIKEKKELEQQQVKDIKELRDEYENYITRKFYIFRTSENSSRGG